MGDGGDQVGAVAVEPRAAAAGADHHRDALTGPDRRARWIRAVTSTSVPSEVNHDCSVSPTRLASPSYGLLVAYQSQLLLVLERHHLRQRPADLDAVAEQPACLRVGRGDDALRVRDHHAVGKGVDDLITMHALRLGAAGLLEARLDRTVTQRVARALARQVPAGPPVRLAQMDVQVSDRAPQRVGQRVSQDDRQGVGAESAQVGRCRPCRWRRTARGCGARSRRRG